ncbi:MAG: hypothetical protein ACEQSR_16340 [Candidatus Methylacidiphilales bacterium]
MLIFFISACSPKGNQYQGAFEIAESLVGDNKMQEQTYFLIMPDEQGCNSCNLHFSNQLKQLGTKKNLLIITDNLALPKTKNCYLDSLDKLRYNDLGFLGTALLVVKNKQFEKVLSLDANTINDLDSIINIIN